MDLKNLKTAVATITPEAKNLVADKNDGRSPFAASIRSNLDHAAALLADHEKWIAANPLPTDSKPVAIGGASVPASRSDKS
jgi:hypothetical protein